MDKATWKDLKLFSTFVLISIAAIAFLFATPYILRPQDTSQFYTITYPSDNVAVIKVEPTDLFNYPGLLLNAMYDIMEHRKVSSIEPLEVRVLLKPIEPKGTN